MAPVEQGAQFRDFPHQLNYHDYWWSLRLSGYGAWLYGLFTLSYWIIFCSDLNTHLYTHTHPPHTHTQYTHRFDPTSVYTISFTSGSTGKPKGCIFARSTWNATISRVRWMWLSLPTFVTHTMIQYKKHLRDLQTSVSLPSFFYFLPLLPLSLPFPSSTPPIPPPLLISFPCSVPPLQLSLLPSTPTPCPFLLLSPSGLLIWLQACMAIFSSSLP